MGFEHILPLNRLKIAVLVILQRFHFKKIFLFILLIEQKFSQDNKIQKTIYTTHGKVHT